MAILHTPDEIRAAGAAAVADWPPLRADQVDKVVALLTPTRRAAAVPAPVLRRAA